MLKITTMAKDKMTIVTHLTKFGSQKAGPRRCIPIGKREVELVMKKFEGKQIKVTIETI